MSDHDAVVRSRLGELLQRDIDEDILDSLTDNLLGQERIIGAAYGHGVIYLPESSFSLEDHTGELLICATNMRVLLVIKERVWQQGWFGSRLTDRFVVMVKKIQLNDIGSADFKYCHLELRLYSERMPIRITCTPDTNLEAFERSLQTALSLPARSRATPSADLADQIGKLAELRNAGDLTQEEFDAAKRKLLGK